MENTNNAEKLNELNEEKYHEMLEQTGVRCDECGEKTFKEYLRPVKTKEDHTLLFCRECYREDVE